MCLELSTLRNYLRGLDSGILGFVTLSKNIHLYWHLHDLSNEKALLISEKNEVNFGH